MYLDDFGNFDDLSQGDDGEGGTSTLIASIFGSAAQVASVAISSQNQPQSTPLYNAYGVSTRVPGAGIVGQSGGGGGFLLLGLAALGGLLIYKLAH